MSLTNAEANTGIYGREWEEHFKHSCRDYECKFEVSFSARVLEVLCRIQQRDTRHLTTIFFKRALSSCIINFKSLLPSAGFEPVRPEAISHVHLII